MIAGICSAALGKGGSRRGSVQRHGANLVDRADGRPPMAPPMGPVDPRSCLGATTRINRPNHGPMRPDGTVEVGEIGVARADMLRYPSTQ